MNDIDLRLKGILKRKTVTSSTGGKGLALSVEGHVNHLIKVRSYLGLLTSPLFYES